MNEQIYELRRRQLQVGGAVAPSGFELEHHLPSGVGLYPFVGQSRAGDVAAQLLRRMPVVSAAAHGGGQDTGFVFDAATPQALERAVLRAAALHDSPAAWRVRMAAAMGEQLSWAQPADDYLSLYRRPLAGADGPGNH